MNKLLCGHCEGTLLNVIGQALRLGSYPTRRWGALFVKWCLSKDVFVDDANNAPGGEQVRQLIEKAGA